MSETQKPSIDERLEALTMNLELTAKQVHELTETSARHERENQRFRRAMRAALEAWISEEPGESQKQ